MLLMISAIIVVGFYQALRNAFIALIKEHIVVSSKIFVISYLYIILFIGFGMIYLMLIQNGTIVLLENGNPVEGAYFYKLQTSLYFSAVTLFSVGYGDIIPVGVGRFIALIEALIGYLLPVAFVARSVFSRDGYKNL